MKTQTIAKQWPTCDDCDAVRVVKSCQVLKTVVILGAWVVFIDVGLGI